MSFYAAEPHKTPKYGKCVMHDGLFQIYDGMGRLNLFIKDFHVGELFGGTMTLQKYYNGSFGKWINEIKKKDLKKVAKLRNEGKLLIEKAQMIEELWKEAESEVIKQ